MIKLMRALVAVVALCACASQAVQHPTVPPVSHAAAVDADPAVHDQLADMLTSLGADYPGVAFELITPAGRVWQGGVGFAEIEERVPINAQTQVSVYSVSKPMTATLAMSLAEHHQLDLDRPIGDYADLPQALRSFTSRELMSHTTGIRHYRHGEWLPNAHTSCNDPSQALAAFASDPLGPRGGFLYSSYGFVLLSDVLAGAARQPFSTLMETRVFQPANMNSTLWQPGQRRPPHGYEQARDGFRAAQNIDNSCKFGAGATIASAEDLARFAAALRGGRLISAEGWRAMTTSAHNAYGLGWGIGTLQDGTPIAAHSGSGIGGSSAIVVDLDRGFVVALVGNLDGRTLIPTGKAMLTLARSQSD